MIFVFLNINFVQSTPNAPSTTPTTQANAPSTTPTNQANAPKGQVNKDNQTKTEWCVPKEGVSEAELQANIDFACGHGIDCSPIKVGGPCFEPNTVASHAAYAMNLFYQTSDHPNSGACDFSKTATLSANNPGNFLTSQFSKLKSIYYIYVFMGFICTLHFL